MIFSFPPVKKAELVRPFYVVDNNFLQIYNEFIMRIRKCDICKLIKAEKSEKLKV